MRFAIAYDNNGDWAVGYIQSGVYCKFSDGFEGVADPDSVHEEMSPRHQSCYIDAPNIEAAVKQTADLAKSYASSKG